MANIHSPRLNREADTLYRKCLQSMYHFKFNLRLSLKTTVLYIDAPIVVQLSKNASWSQPARPVTCPPIQKAKHALPSPCKPKDKH